MLIMQICHAPHEPLWRELQELHGRRLVKSMKNMIGPASVIARNTLHRLCQLRLHFAKNHNTIEPTYQGETC